MNIRVLIVLILAFLTAALCAPVVSAQDISLTLLYTNDLHGRLQPFDYTAPGIKENNVGGAARRATLIRKIKAESKSPVIVMDAGDVFVYGTLEKYEGKPDFEVINAIGYDAITLGNDDFRGNLYTKTPGPNGLKILKDRIKQARFPVVSANVFEKSTGRTLVQPYIVLNRGGIRVGIFGLTTPMATGYPETTALEIRDLFKTTRKTIAQLKPKCDLIIALTHIGYPYDLLLASQFPEISAIIGGHTHTLVQKPELVKSPKTSGPEWYVGGTIVCQDGEWGRSLGRLDLTLRKNTGGRYLVSNYKGELIKVDSSIKPAGDIEEIISRYPAVAGK